MRSATRALAAGWSRAGVHAHTGALILLLAAGVVQADKPDEKATILVLGDSLSAAYGVENGEGWVALLKQRLDAKGYADYAVVNASVSGETSAGARARLPELLKGHQPAIVIIEIGGNDGLRGQPPELFAENLTAMVERAQAGGARVVLAGVPLPPNLGQSYIQRFRRVYHQVAANHNAALIPNILDGVAGQSKLMQPDGIHPTAAAQPRMLANVWPTLRSLLEDGSISSRGRGQKSS